MSTNTPEDSNRIHFISSQSTLLSGSVNECRTASDDGCSGGFASVCAFARHETNNEPYLVLPTADRSSPFVQMHPLGWNVNRLILNDLFGLKVFVSSPSLVYQNDDGIQDSKDLQTDDFPFVLTNVNVPPENSWFAFTRHVFFDDTTGLAIISVVNSGEPLTVSQIDSTKGALDYIRKVNMESGCIPTTSRYFQYLNFTMPVEDRRCWIPFVQYADLGPQFEEFVNEIINYDYPPAVIADFDGNDATLEAPRKMGPRGTWVTSYTKDTRSFFMHSLVLNDEKNWITNATFTVKDLRDMPASYKDDRYVSDIEQLAKYADEALSNDPIVGQSTSFPVTREGNYRRCKAGECEVGNLFTDALRWKTKSDFAFITSGGLRGSGWPAGNVRISNIWESLPFANSLCTGKMSGVSMFKLFNFSTSVSDFEGNNAGSGELLQVSGVRVTYNTNLNTNRLVNLEIWDSEREDFVPVERLRLYDFATDDFLCRINQPYPQLTGDGFTIRGEIPGTVVDELHQEIVADYLSHLDELNEVYDGTISGRLVNNTLAERPLDFIQTEIDCGPQRFWQEDVQSCQNCPLYSDIDFTKDFLEFSATATSTEKFLGNIKLRNNHDFAVSVSLESSPSWLLFKALYAERPGPIEQFVDGSPFVLSEGKALELSFEASAEALEPGTALGTVAVGVSDGGSYPGCKGQDVTFDVFMRVQPEEDFQQIGNFRILGFAASFVIMLLATLFAIWVGMNRKTKVVRAFQPLFLLTLCVGVFIIGSSMIPMSIDDGFVSHDGADIACMAVPWLVCIGFSLTFAALCAKLWRINRLFDVRQFRRMKVTEKDVIAPFIIMFLVDIPLLIALTVVDPIHLKRQAVPGEAWKTYAICAVEGTEGKVILSFVGAANIMLLAFTAWQAFRARTISDEFSESKNLGVALFASVQLFIVGVPVIFLIRHEDTTPTYFLHIALFFSLCLSILLSVFVPMMTMQRKASSTTTATTAASIRVSGLYVESPRPTSERVEQSSGSPRSEPPRRWSSVDIGSVLMSPSMTNNSGSDHFCRSTGSLFTRESIGINFASSLNAIDSSDELSEGPLTNNEQEQKSENQV